MIFLKKTKKRKKYLALCHQKYTRAKPYYIHNTFIDQSWDSMSVRHPSCQLCIVALFFCTALRFSTPKHQKQQSIEFSSWIFTNCAPQCIFASRRKLLPRETNTTKPLSQCSLFIVCVVTCDNTHTPSPSTYPLSTHYHLRCLNTTAAREIIPVQPII